MPKYPFLSPEWIEEARKIYEGAGADVSGTPPMKMNQVITGVPFGGGTIDAHIDSSEGAMQMDLGHIEGADVKITVPYDVAKAIFIQGDAATGMQAFMSGQIKVEGDMTKLMAMQGTAPGPEAMAIQQQLKDITE